MAEEAAKEFGSGPRQNQINRSIQSKMEKPSKVQPEDVEPYEAGRQSEKRVSFKDEPKPPSQTPKDQAIAPIAISNELA